MLALLATLALADDGAIRASLEALELDADPVLAHLDTQEAALAARLDLPPDRAARLGAVLRHQIRENLRAKVVLQADGDLGLDAGRVQATVVDYEVFKLETYLSSGVFPKRYFG